MNIRETVENLTYADVVALTERYAAPNYHPLPVNIVRARDFCVYDDTGKEYIDCIGCYSAVSNGHLAESVVSAMKEQLDTLTLTSRAVFTPELALFFKAICEYTETDMVCPTNTGAEAVETALKFGRKWAYEVKGIPEYEAEVIVAEDNFHGRTITVISFSTEPQFQKGFGPFTPGFKTVSYGDITELSDAITGKTAAVLLEPIQAEGGIVIPPAGYLTAVRQLCHDNRVLLIWDEVQTGFCRTGKKFAWQYEDARPNLMCLGKALGGGVYPVSAVVGDAEVISLFKPGDHGSTFGGNPLGSIAAIAAMQDMERKNLAENSARMGALLLEGLKSLGHGCIADVRGRGLLIGLELTPGADTKKLSDSFLANGVLTKETKPGTFRFTPPLTITPEAVGTLVRKVDNALTAPAFA